MQRQQAFRSNDAVASEQGKSPARACARSLSPGRVQTGAVRISRSGHDPAIDHKLTAGHIAAVVTGKKQHTIGYVLGFPGKTHRHSC
jgi:hypothetical protein